MTLIEKLKKALPRTSNDSKYSIFYLAFGGETISGDNAYLYGTNDNNHIELIFSNLPDKTILPLMGIVLPFMDERLEDSPAIIKIELIEGAQT